MFNLVRTFTLDNKYSLIALLAIIASVLLFVYYFHLPYLFIIFIASGIFAFIILINYPILILLLELYVMPIATVLNNPIAHYYKIQILLSFTALLFHIIIKKKSFIMEPKRDIYIIIIYIMWTLICSIAAYSEHSFAYILEIITKSTLFILLVNIIKSKTEFDMYIVMYVILLTMSNVLGIAQVLFKIDLYGFGYRASGIAPNPNGTGYYEALAVPFITYLLMLNKNMLPRIALIVAFILCPVVAILSESRGSSLTVFIVLLAIFTLSMRNYYLLLGILISVIIIGSLWQEPYTERVRNTLKNPKYTEESRGYYFRAGLEMIKDSPIFGVGVNKFGVLFRGTYSKRVNSPTAPVQVPHNGYIDIATNTGIPGLLLILSLFYGWFTKLLRNRKKCISNGYAAGSAISMLMIISIMGYMVVGFFETITGTKMLLCFPAYVYIITKYMNGENKTAEQQVPIITNQ